MDWGEIIELIGIVVGSGALGVFVQRVLNRKKHSLELQKLNAETDVEIREKYRQQANQFSEQVLFLEGKVFDLERMIAESKRKEIALEEKYARAVEHINKCKKESPLDDEDRTEPDHAGQ